MFLAGRARERLEAVAADVAAAGGKAEVAVLDATDETAVDAHADAVAARAGSIDVSFNLITRGDGQGTPLRTWRSSEFPGRSAHRGGDDVPDRPRGRAAHGRAALRRDPAPHQRLRARRGADDGQHRPGRRGHRHADPLPGGRARPHGVRAVGIHTAGVLGTLSAEKVAAVTGEADPQVEQMMAMLTGMTMLKRRPELDQIAATAAFLASDGAGAITSGMLNASCGLIAG